MVLNFRIRNTVFSAGRAGQRSSVRPITLLLPSVEEAALICTVDDMNRLVPRRDVFLLSFTRTGPVIEGFENCILGEFMKSQIECLCENNEPPSSCEINGLETFLEMMEPGQVEELRDLVSICEFRKYEFSPEAAIRFLKESGFFDEYIIVGVKYGNGWRRSRCITTFEGRAQDAATILGHLEKYFQKDQQDKPNDERSK